MLSPDHGIGVSVLIAGPDALSDRWPLRAAAAETFVAAAEWAGREHAARYFSGTFAADGADASSSNLTIVVDAHDGVGLRVDTLFLGGVDAKPAVLFPGAELPPDLDVLLQLYPTGWCFLV